MILAIDTSTGQASVALAGNEGTHAETSWTAAGNHSRSLGRAVDELTMLEDVELSAVSAIVVAIGPGSFSGTRVGISAGKGLALALDVPLAGVSTLDAIGFQALHGASSVTAVIPAGRGDLYCARYEGSPGEFARISGPEIVPLSRLLSDLNHAGIVAGPGSAAIVSASQQTANQVTVQPVEMRLRRAGFLAELGRRYLEQGGADQVDTLEPLYLRRSAAEEKRGL